MVGNFIFRLFHYFLNLKKKSNYLTHNRSCILVSRSKFPRILIVLKNVLHYFIKNCYLICQNTWPLILWKSCLKNLLLHNYIQCSLYPPQETIYLLQGPAYASERILWKIFQGRILDIIRNSSAKLTTKSFTKSDDKRICNFMKHQRQR